MQYKGLLFARLTSSMLMRFGIAEDCRYNHQLATVFLHNFLSGFAKCRSKQRPLRPDPSQASRKKTHFDVPFMRSYRTLSWSFDIKGDGGIGPCNRAVPGITLGPCPLELFSYWLDGCSAWPVETRTRVFVQESCLNLSPV